jgi:hypothetical protein
MEWFKKHYNKLFLIGMLISIFCIYRKFAEYDKEMQMIKTVFIMKEMFPETYRFTDYISK